MIASGQHEYFMSDTAKDSGKFPKMLCGPRYVHSMCVPVVPVIGRSTCLPRSYIYPNMIAYFTGSASVSESVIPSRPRDQIRRSIDIGIVINVASKDSIYVSFFTGAVHSRRYAYILGLL
jgi:hypothetical protein